MLNKLSNIFKNISNLTVFTLIIATSLFVFSPIVSIQVYDNIYDLNGFKILTHPCFKIMHKNLNCFVNFPLILRITVILILIFTFCIFLFLKIKKYNFSATLSLFCSFSVFLFVISLNIVKNEILIFNLDINKISIHILWPYKLASILFVVVALIAVAQKGKEKLAESIFFCSTAISVFIVCSVLIYITICGIPAIFKIGFFKFLFGQDWIPSENKFGVLKFIAASIFATVGSVFISVPIGVFCAIFLSEIAPKKIVLFIKPIVEILSGIPSVVYGFFGMNIIVPLIKQTFKNFKTSNSAPVVGDSLLAVILVLSIMIIPTIISTSYVAIKGTPKSFKEASLNLGATKIETIFKVTLKSAKSAIFAGTTLAVSRAIGETMAVIMVAGNVPNMPDLLAPTRLLTTAIAMDMSYATGLFREALFGIGLVLLFLIVVVNLSFKVISKKNLKL